MNNFKCIHNFFISELEEFQRLSMIQNFAIQMTIDVVKINATEGHSDFDIIKKYMLRAR